MTKKWVINTHLLIIYKLQQKYFHLLFLYYYCTIVSQHLYVVWNDLWKLLWFRIVVRSISCVMRIPLFTTKISRKICGHYTLINKAKLFGILPKSPVFYYPLCANDTGVQTLRELTALKMLKREKYWKFLSFCILKVYTLQKNSF